MKYDPVIGHCQFADGAMRPVYDDGKRQYVIDDDGYKVHGVWLIPKDEPDLPVIVPGDEQTQHVPEVPADLQAVVLHCLAKEPAERFADTESLETALASCQTAGAWTGKEAASWWRGHAGTNAKGVFQGVNEERGRTSRGS